MTTTPTIVILENNTVQRHWLETIVARKLEFTVNLADTPEQLLALLGAHDGHADLVILGASIADGHIGNLLKYIKTVRPALPVLLLHGSPDEKFIVNALQEGVHEVIDSSKGDEALETAVKNIFLNDALKRLKQRMNKGVTFASIIGTSQAVKDAIRLAERASSSSVPVLIEGESGVGKELFARAIHGTGSRADKPFVAVNCGAIPENLVESILFGHEKGAFTGAIAKTIGKFREAEGGTLFLDEVGELKPDIQVKLLRALQEAEVEPVGGKQPVKVDIRIISATNRKLSEQVAQGSFREDLYYRLNVFPIAVPSLQERKEDIIPLCQYFLQGFSQEEGKKTIDGISLDAQNLLKQYSWPGNIRQLKNILHRAALLCDGKILDLSHFPHLFNEMSEHKESIKPVAASMVKVLPFFEHKTLPALDGTGHIRSLREVESELIQRALHHYNWHMSEVARRLGIGRSTLYRKLAELGIEIPRQEGGAVKYGTGN